MAKKKPVSHTYISDTKCFRKWDFDCVMTEAINPVTKNQVKLTPPVKISCYEDFVKFNDQWEKFCQEVTDSRFDPDEIWFTLE